MPGMGALSIMYTMGRAHQILVIHCSQLEPHQPHPDGVSPHYEHHVVSVTNNKEVHQSGCSVQSVHDLLLPMSGVTNDSNRHDPQLVQLN